MGATIQTIDAVRTPVEEVLSPRGAWKAEIYRRDDGNFQVLLMRWFEEVVPDHGKVESFWSEVGTAVSITDSLDAARKIAGELLKAHARSEFGPGSDSRE